MRITATQEEFLFEMAYSHFKCSSTKSGGSGRSKKEIRRAEKEEKERQNIKHWGSRLIEKVNSDNPPKDADEAVVLLIGLSGKLLSYIFPQYALAITIIVWFWNHLASVE